MRGAPAALRAKASMKCICCQPLERIRGARLANTWRRRLLSQDAFGFQTIVFGAQDAQIARRAGSTSRHRPDVVDLQRDSGRASPPIWSHVRTPEPGTSEDLVAHRHRHVALGRSWAHLLRSAHSPLAPLLSFSGVATRDELIQRDLEELFEGRVGDLVPNQCTRSLHLGHEFLAR